MASNYGRHLLNVAGKLTRSCTYGPSATFSPRPTGSSFLMRTLGKGQSNLGMTMTPSLCLQSRSLSTLWAPSRSKLHQHLCSPASMLCGCRFTHSEGDKELSNFLSEEIKHEKSIEKHGGKLPKIPGFEVSIDGADITLSKKQNNESILVTLNINNSVDADGGDNVEEQSDKPAEMVSKPSFLVEINGGSGTTLAFQCSFPPPREEFPEAEGEEEYDDVIEIEEVALLPNGEDWDEKSYCVNASIMDGNLYDLMLNKLEDHGIDANFVEQLVEFSTAYEHQKYVDFLQGLKSFVDSK